jgi:hypothetical protein
MAKKFLDSANIITGIKQMRSKGVTEGVATSVLDNTRFADCFKEGVDFRLCHFCRVTNLVEYVESPSPMTIGLLRAAAVMTSAKGFTKTIL